MFSPKRQKRRRPSGAVLAGVKNDALYAESTLTGIPSVRAARSHSWVQSPYTPYLSATSLLIATFNDHVAPGGIGGGGTCQVDDRPGQLLRAAHAAKGNHACPRRQSCRACVLFERTNYWGIKASWPVYLLDDTDGLPESGWEVEVKAYDRELRTIAGRSPRKWSWRG